MKFGWINALGALIVVLMLIPNTIYAIKNKDEKNLCTNRFMNIAEQVGRYACIVLMWFPLLVWKFGFASEISMLIYLLGNALLIAVYWILFAVYSKVKNNFLALVLAIVPTIIFLMSGVLLHHVLLMIFAIIFGVGHIFVTSRNFQ